MYEVISDGTVVDRRDAPVYITLRSPNGTPQQTTAENADCVSVRGQLYQLPGAKNVDESLPKAILRKADGGELSHETEQLARATQADLEDTSAEMESAICGLDIMYADRIAELEVTLCEMDIMVHA